MNQREIKFRAWDRYMEGKHMVKVDMLDFRLGTLYGKDERDFSHDMDMKFYELMQFTGLKDKNGKEIWEGDVIRCYHEKGVIENTLGCFGFQQTRDNFTTLLDIWERGDGHKVEVIGNIYENPELLK